MNSKNNFKKGSVELLVLCLLQEADCYGYQLTQLISQRSGGLLRPVYPDGTFPPSQSVSLLASDRKCVWAAEARYPGRVNPLAGGGNGPPGYIKRSRS